MVVVAGALLSLVIYSRAHDGSSGSTASTLGVGATAPDVRLPATDGSTVDLQAARGKRNVLLYFYEHAG